PSACRSEGAWCGTHGRRFFGASGIEGTPSRRWPPGPGDAPRGPRAAGLRGSPSLLAVTTLPNGLRDHPAEVQGGHVLLRQLEGLLVRHAAPLQGLVEIRHRGPEPRGCVLSVDRVREAVQERGHLLREHLEHLFHFARFHSVFLLT